MLLVGCDELRRQSGVESGAANQVPHTFVYECEDADVIVVRVQGDSAWLFGPDRTLELPRLASASGARFSDGKSAYWRKGEQARFILDGLTLAACSNNRARAIWEDAKLRGVDFRAVGNEPGWQLEIFDQDKVVFDNNYGQERYLFAASEPKVDHARRVTRYQLNHRLHRLTVQLEDKPCNDSMSGEAFATSVILIFDGTPLSGCGRALH